MLSTAVLECYEYRGNGWQSISSWRIGGKPKAILVGSSPLQLVQFELGLPWFTTLLWLKLGILFQFTEKHHFEQDVHRLMLKLYGIKFLWSTEEKRAVSPCPPQFCPTRNKGPKSNFRSSKAIHGHWVSLGFRIVKHLSWRFPSLKHDSGCNPWTIHQHNRSGSWTNPDL